MSTPCQVLPSLPILGKARESVKVTEGEDGSVRQTGAHTQVGRGAKNTTSSAEAGAPCERRQSPGRAWHCAQLLQNHPLQAWPL